MKGVSDFVIVYDISSDKERRNIEKIIKDYGFRVQKSVFECKLNLRLRRELLERLRVLNPQTGFIKLYRLEYSFNKPAIGKDIKNSLDSGHAFIV